MSAAMGYRPHPTDKPLGRPPSGGGSGRRDPVVVIVRMEAQPGGSGASSMFLSESEVTDGCR